MEMKGFYSTHLQETFVFVLIILALTAPSKAAFRVSAVVLSFRPVTISVFVSSRG